VRLRSESPLKEPPQRPTPAEPASAAKDKTL
jgi:hypothetical protein